METLLQFVKYGFVVGVALELGLIARALVRLAREKASPAVSGE